MAMMMKQNKYTTNKQILMFPDHKVAFAHTFKKADSAAADVNGRKILKAGTIYPTNDGSAIGVVENDIDVTDGDEAGALLIHGFINCKKLPAAPEEAAKTALPGIIFLNAGE